jgi:hypothetical protein
MKNDSRNNKPPYALSLLQPQIPLSHINHITPCAYIVSRINKFNATNGDRVIVIPSFSSQR